MLVPLRHEFRFNVEVVGREVCVQRGGIDAVDGIALLLLIMTGGDKLFELLLPCPTHLVELLLLLVRYLSVLLFLLLRLLNFMHSLPIPSRSISRTWLLILTGRFITLRLQIVTIVFLVNRAVRIHHLSCVCDQRLHIVVNTRTARVNLP